MELNVKEAIESTSHINILLFLSLALSSSLEYNDEIDSTTDSNQWVNLSTTSNGFNRAHE